MKNKLLFFEYPAIFLDFLSFSTSWIVTSAFRNATYLLINTMSISHSQFPHAKLNSNRSLVHFRLYSYGLFSTSKTDKCNSKHVLFFDTSKSPNHVQMNKHKKCQKIMWTHFSLGLRLDRFSSYLIPGSINAAF